MAINQRQHGSQGQIKADPTGGSTYADLASMNAWTLNMKRDTVDVTAFNDPNKVYVVGLQDLKGTLGGWFDAGDHVLFDIAFGNIPAGLELIPTSLVPAYKWAGPAYVDASVDVKANGAVSIAGDFVASAGWTFTPGP